MRTNVVLDDELMAAAMAASQLPTKRAVIEAGLRALIRLRAQGEIRSLRGKLHWEGDLDAMRSDPGSDDENLAGANPEDEQA
jgi:Arc/MetJ family transcription regulator